MNMTPNEIIDQQIRDSNEYAIGYLDALIDIFMQVRKSDLTYNDRMEVLELINYEYEKRFRKEK